MDKTKEVLFAHQSAIPHYRIPFYNALERLRPAHWRFDVVFDPSEVTKHRFFHEPLDVNQFHFSTVNVNTYSFRLAGKIISYQTFWRKAGKYDLVIVENAVNNLTYPLCQLHRFHHTRVAYWGHGKDRSAEKPSSLKSLAEKLKIYLVHRSDGFFAYTQGVKTYLEKQGVPPDNIFVSYNTIDINEQRGYFTQWSAKKQEIKQEIGIFEKNVLLFVGRFTRNKRIGFLLESFSILRKMDPDFRLLFVGSGKELPKDNLPENVSWLGPIIDLNKLAPIYVASDVFVFPGAVGLGPLQAMCYDLPAITIDASNHMPEIEYLTPMNSIILETATTPAQYANTILSLFQENTRLDALKASTWTSIQNLTVDQMARNFIMGINSILGL